MTKKRLIFKKNFDTIYIPFMVTNLTPWQDQIGKEIIRLQKDYIIRKSARFGYEINEYGASIKVYKS